MSLQTPLPVINYINIHLAVNHDVNLQHTKSESKSTNTHGGAGSLHSSRVASLGRDGVGICLGGGGNKAVATGGDDDGYGSGLDDGGDRNGVGVSDSVGVDGRCLDCASASSNYGGGLVCAVGEETVLVAAIVVVVAVVLPDAGLALWDQCVCVVGCADALEDGG